MWFASRLRHGDYSTPSHAAINTDFLPQLRKIERQCAENNRSTVLYLAQQALGITQKGEPLHSTAGAAPYNPKFQILNSKS